MAYLTIGKMNGVGKLQKNTPVTVGAGSMDNYVDVAGTIGTFGELTKDSGIRALIAGQIDWENRWTFKCYFSIALAAELRQSSRWIINGRIFSINSYEKIGEKNFNYRFSLTEKEAVLPETGDPDASAFITAAGISDSTIETALQNFVTALKDASIWTKFVAIYPFVGGTEAKHKWNLKNPVDSDAAYRLTFVNGAVHAATGVTFNGTTQYADTHLVPSTSGLLQNSFGMSYYARTAGTGTTQMEMGGQDGAGNIVRLLINYSGSVYGEINSGGGASGSASGTVLGLFDDNRSAADQTKIYRAGVTYLNPSIASIALVSTSLFIGGFNNNGSPSAFSNRQTALNAFHSGFNDAEELLWYTAVQTFETELSRQV